MEIKELNGEYKAKYREHRERLGRELSTDDPEFWELTEWYKQNVPGEEKENFDGEPQVKRVKVEQTERPVPRVIEKPTHLVCVECNAEFPRPITRGRPPKKCVPCRSK